MEVSMKEAIKWEKDWIKFWNESSVETRKSYGVENTPPTIESEYTNCFQCGNNYKNFVDAQDDDVPDGCTISGILGRQY
jgi:hypothetical protein